MTFLINLYVLKIFISALMLFDRVEVYDKEVDDIIKQEEERQRTSLELIASENFASVSVLQVASSVLCNKYSEGQVGQRYYGGTECVDQIEELCKKRALELYGLDPEVWDCNVQVLSGSNANLAVYLGLIGKDGKLMGLDLPSGGHLTHGFKTPTRKISASSIFFESKSYKTNKNGEIDYDELEKEFNEFRPGLLICGASAYSLDFDYERLRSIAKDCYLMCDMAHISGFVATGLLKNCFEHCDVVTTTTHKILRGPRSAIIFYRKIKMVNNKKIDVKSAIDKSVFPGLNGGPHNQKIAALAVALKQAKSEEYKEYCLQVKKNAKIMSEHLIKLGCVVECGRTENHLFLLKHEGVGGSEIERACELANISLNKNSISTDKSPLKPSAVRIGLPAMTTRGFKESDAIKAAEFVYKAICIAKSITEKSNNFEDFNEKITESKDIKELKKEVIDFVEQFPIPKFNYRQE
ncbi:mel-32 [Ecytonucleospora hepatopenaei]|uniref:glycine hydroxymethyltransferase n=1 Tax=Ecytonucleospora hepatopenaei TaxID=646526 RepID=A0A1W0E363_9MICR|nr:mel-32 [Ecytonucleospora hepatopenaei]